MAEDLEDRFVRVHEALGAAVAALDRIAAKQGPPRATAQAALRLIAHYYPEVADLRPREPGNA